MWGLIQLSTLKRNRDVLVHSSSDSEKRWIRLRCARSSTSCLLRYWRKAPDFQPPACMIWLIGQPDISMCCAELRRKECHVKPFKPIVDAISCSRARSRRTHIEEKTLDVLDRCLCSEMPWASVIDCNQYGNQFLEMILIIDFSIDFFNYKIIDLNS